MAKLSIVLIIAPALAPRQAPCQHWTLERRVGMFEGRDIEKDKTMGFLDFASAVGKKLGLGKSKESDEAALRKEVEALGLAVGGVTIAVAGDTVTVGGTTSDQAEKEKILIALGNVQGVAKVEDELQVEQPAPEAVYYTVVRGDTLWGISKKHYGSGNKYMTIFEANTPMLGHPDKIYPGQMLRIPPLD